MIAAPMLRERDDLFHGNYVCDTYEPRVEHAEYGRVSTSDWQMG
jgi:hypothetical protein